VVPRIPPKAPVNGSNILEAEKKAANEPKIILTLKIPPNLARIVIREAEKIFETGVFAFIK